MIKLSAPMIFNEHLYTAHILNSIEDDSQELAISSREIEPKFASMKSSQQ